MGARGGRARTARAGSHRAGPLGARGARASRSGSRRRRSRRSTRTSSTCQDLCFFSRDELDRLRGGGAARRRPDRERAARRPEVLRGFDLITTSFPHYVERFRALGVDSEYLPIAFDERVLRADRPARAATSTSPSSAASTRGVHPGGVALLAAARGAAAARGVGLRRRRAPARRCASAGAARRGGSTCTGSLARARISLNRHIEAAEGYANNMRLFESTGVGLAARDRGGAEPRRPVRARSRGGHLRRRGRPRREGRSTSLAHEDERAAIAAAGQARTLRDHTYARRIAQLADMLQARLRREPPRVLHALRLELPGQGARPVPLAGAPRAVVPPDRVLLRRPRRSGCSTSSRLPQPLDGRARGARGVRPGAALDEGRPHAGRVLLDGDAGAAALRLRDAAGGATRSRTSTPT